MQDAHDAAGRGEGGERLPCGSDLDDLLEQVADRTAPVGAAAAHQNRCPHCRSLLVELRELWEPVHAVAAETVQAPAALLTAVMTAVRRLAAGSRYAVLAAERGATRISSSVVSAIARLAAVRVPGVELAIQRPPGGDDGAGVAGRRTVVDLELAVGYGTDALAAAGRVRDLVARELAALTALAVDEVNITIADVVPGRVAG